MRIYDTNHRKPRHSGAFAPIIGMLIEKIRCSDTKELIIPADELLPQGYAEYLERVMQTNNIEKNIGRQDAYDLTAKQIGMLKVKRQQCFDKAKAETTENAIQFNLETNESFFLLTNNQTVVLFVTMKMERKLWFR